VDLRAVESVVDEEDEVGEVAHPAAGPVVISPDPGEGQGSREEEPPSEQGFLSAAHHIEAHVGEPPTGEEGLDEEPPAWAARLVGRDAGRPTAKRLPPRVGESVWSPSEPQ
jgi:hypothetical protein